jgi:hypothetical protein
VTGSSTQMEISSRISELHVITQPFHITEKSFTDGDCTDTDLYVLQKQLLVAKHAGVSKSFRTGRLERDLQMVQLSATRCSRIAILWVSLASFAAVTISVAPQRVFIVVRVYFVIHSVRKLLDTPSYIVIKKIVAKLGFVTSKEELACVIALITSNLAHWWHKSFLLLFSVSPSLFC